MPVMTSSCCVIMGCCCWTLSDDTVNFKLALQSPSGLSVMRAASLCQQAPRMESDMAIFSKLPCHWQSCSYLTNNQAGNQTVLNCQFRTWEAAGVSIQQGRESGTALPDTGRFLSLFIHLLVCLVGFFPGKVGGEVCGVLEKDPILTQCLGKVTQAFRTRPRSSVARLRHVTSFTSLREMWPWRII